MNGVFLSLLEVLGVLGSGLGEVGFSVGEDFELDSFVLDFSFELSDFSGQDGDFGFGVVSGDGGSGDSSVVLVDFVSAFGFLGVVEGVSFGLLGGQVLSDFGEEFGDVSEGGFVFHLEGNGVEDFLSELGSFNLFQLVENGVGSFGGLFKEHGVGVQYGQE